MRQTLEQDEKAWRRLKLLIVTRLVVVSLFLIITIFLGKVRVLLPVWPVLQNLLYAVILIMYVMSLFYTLLLKKRKYFQFNIYTQLIVDIGLISFLVYLTGGISSNYSQLYILVIIYSAIFLGRRGAFIIATLSSVAYGLVLNFQYLNIFDLTSLTSRISIVEGNDVFVRLIVHVISFFFVAFLASIVVEQEKKTKSLLVERESAFDQLDLLFRSIIESVDTGIMTITLQGNIKTFNRAAETITGFRLAAIENQPVLEVFPDFKAFFKSGAGDLIISRKEVKITSREGARIHLGCSVSPLKDRNSQQIGHIVIFQDLTQIKRMEENLEKSKNLALIGEMAAGLAHEMRNPLASITGSIQLLGRNVRMGETDRRLMQIIMRGKDQLDHFVRDFLMLSRPVPEARESVDVDEVAGEVLENLKIANEWPQDIMLSRTTSGQNKAFANKEQIWQIIQNLVLNALQAIDGPGKLSLDIQTVKLEDEKNYAAIKITDDGCGIEEKDLKNVFRPFYTNKEKGTGLGLAIVGRIVDGYGGKINIESKVNQGTSVTVWLPCN